MPEFSNLMGAMGAGQQPAPGAAMPPTGGEQPPMGASAPTMSKEEMVADLQSKAADIENKNQQLNANEILDQNKLEDMRMDILKNLFDLLKQNGVDPADQNAVKDFLEKLSEQDPDLFEIFEMAFDNLTQSMAGTGAPEGQVTPPDGELEGPGMMPGQSAGTLPTQGGGGAVGADAGLMGKFNNLAGDVMRG